MYVCVCAGVGGGGCWGYHLYKTLLLDTSCKLYVADNSFLTLTNLQELCPTIADSTGCKPPSCPMWKYDTNTKERKIQSHTLWKILSVSWWGQVAGLASSSLYYIPHVIFLDLSRCNRTQGTFCFLD